MSEFSFGNIMAITRDLILEAGDILDQYQKEGSAPSTDIDTARKEVESTLKSLYGAGVNPIDMREKANQLVSRIKAMSEQNE